MKLTKTIEVYPGYDRREQGGGWHGAELQFSLISPDLSITFVCLTDWLPKQSQDAMAKHLSRISTPGSYPRAMDYTLHSTDPWPTSASQNIHKACMYLPEGSTCYSVRSSKLHEELQTALLDGGSDAVWSLLQKQYAEIIQTTRRG